MAKPTPPARPPSYFRGDFPGPGSVEPGLRLRGAIHFEFPDHDQEDDPVAAARSYSENIARCFASEPEWRATGGWLIRPGEPVLAGATHSVPFSASRPNSDLRVEGLFHLTPDPSNWVRIELVLGDIPVFVGFLDRVYEDFELWPSGASGEGDPPGRIGKQRDWVELSASAWPQLRAVGGDGSFRVSLPARA